MTLYGSSRINCESDMSSVFGDEAMGASAGFISWVGGVEALVPRSGMPR